MGKVTGIVGLVILLCACQDGVMGQPLAGFTSPPCYRTLARVDYGEFGRTQPTAVIDTIGVEPGHGRQGIGAAGARPSASRRAPLWSRTAPRMAAPMSRARAGKVSDADSARHSG